MRIYANCKELMSEIFRDVYEMGKIVKPKHYQNKDISDNEEYITKEVEDYQYMLRSCDDYQNLFITDKTGINEKWVSEEFTERLFWDGGRGFMNPGLAYKLREETWKQFLDKRGTFDYTYNERIRHRIRGWDENKADKWTNNLDQVINLLKEDPDTRKAIIPIFDIEDVRYNDGSKRIPCSMYYNFLVRPDSKGNLKVNIKYHLRSSDVFTHFGNDVALAWLLMAYVAEQTGYVVGTLTHTIDSLHCYKKDWEALRSIIGEL